MQPPAGGGKPLSDNGDEDFDDEVDCDNVDDDNDIVDDDDQCV